MNYKEMFIIEYEDKCKEKISNEIEETTRFNNNNLEIKKIDCKTSDFFIDVEYEIEVVKIENTITGIPTIDTNNALIYRETFLKNAFFEYNFIISKSIEEEKNKDDTINNLLVLASNNPYGTISEKKFLHEKTEYFYYIYPCEVCHSKGTVKCRVCDGTGTTRCYSCNGHGYNDKNRFDTSNRLIHWKEKCSRCNGKGKIKCSNCGGHKVIECKTCQGSGYFTKKTILEVYAVLNYKVRYSKQTQECFEDIVTNICKEANLEKISYIKLMSVEETEKNSLNSEDFEDIGRGITAKYEATMISADISLNINEIQSNWILYGKKLLYLYDVGGVFELLLKNDLENLMIKNKYSIFNPFFKLEAIKSLIPFMQSEINQKLLSAQAESPYDSSAELKIKIEQKMSHQYIEDSIKNLEKIIYIVNFWAVVKWCVITFLISLITFKYGSTYILERKFDPKMWIFSTFLINSFISITTSSFLLFLQRKWLTENGTYFLYNWVKKCKRVTYNSSFFFFFTLVNTGLISVAIAKFPVFFSLPEKINVYAPREKITKNIKSREKIKTKPAKSSKTNKKISIKQK